MNTLVQLLANVLVALFALGLAGCLVVIPITAYGLFDVLFEKDLEDER
jgi:hypothetical protein